MTKLTEHPKINLGKKVDIRTMTDIATTIHRRCSVLPARQEIDCSEAKEFSGIALLSLYTLLKDSKNFGGNIVLSNLNMPICQTADSQKLEHLVPIFMADLIYEAIRKSITRSSKCPKQNHEFFTSYSNKKSFINFEGIQ